MIIDFHAHIFPDKIAKRAINKLSESANMDSFLDGTKGNLSDSMKLNAIDISVIMPVATSVEQCRSINDTVYELNENSKMTGIVSFGGIHPGCTNYKDVLNELSSHNVKGIKIHPVFQNTYFDNIKYLRILDYAFEHNMYVMVHAGYDISFPGADYVNVKHIVPVLDSLKTDKLILAHMGGWGDWSNVYEEILGRDVYIDTSFTTLCPGQFAMSDSLFLNFVKKHGSKRILFGSDTPWVDQGLSAEYIKKSALSDTEKADILCDNAITVLGTNI